MTDMSSRVVHPVAKSVPVLDGSAKVEVRPWTMAQRAELRPRLGKLIERVAQEQAREIPNLAELFLYAEDELAEIVQRSVQLPEGLSWDELYWEDLPTMAQAVWETCIVREDGKGIGGKLTGVLAGLVQAARRPTQEKPNVVASPSSPDAGAPTPSDSATA